MQLAVEHIGLAARNPIALRQWYAAVLGAREVFTDGKTPPAFLLALGGDLMIEIYPADSARAQPGDNRLAGWRHLALRVDSIEVAREALIRQGVIFEDDNVRVTAFNVSHGKWKHAFGLRFDSADRSPHCCERFEATREPLHSN